MVAATHSQLRRQQAIERERVRGIVRHCRRPKGLLQKTFLHFDSGHMEVRFVLIPDKKYVRAQYALAAIKSGWLIPCGGDLFGDPPNAQTWTAKVFEEEELWARASLHDPQGTTKETTMVNVREYLAGVHIKFDDLRDGPRIEIIEDVRPGKYGKLDLIFQSGDMLGLNATNMRKLVKARGLESDDWRGLKVELSQGQLEFNNEPTDSVILEIVEEDAQPKKKQRASTSKPSDGPVDDSIPF